MAAKPTIYAEDAASVAAYKAHAVKLETPLAFMADAMTRANLVLERAAVPQWHLTDVAIDLLHISAADAGPYRDLLPGIRCDMRGLPAPAPSNGFNGVVEGWQETYRANGQAIAHTLTLALSDARWSYAVLSWDGVPPETVWAHVESAWQEIMTIDDLTAVGG